MNDEIYNYIFDIRYAVDQLEKAVTVPDKVYDLQRQLKIARDALEDIASSGAESGWCMDRAAEALSKMEN